MIPIEHSRFPKMLPLPERSGRGAEITKQFRENVRGAPVPPYFHFSLGQLAVFGRKPLLKFRGDSPGVRRPTPSQLAKIKIKAVARKVGARIIGQSTVPRAIQGKRMSQPRVG